MYAIEVKNVCKEYKLYKHPKDAFLEIFSFKKKHKIKMALTDVSFNVEHGETFGVFGTNGSGKSTILSMVNGSCFPSSGSITTDGAVSLLNVGAGIIPNYTGYENIKYKCGISGLNKKQTDLIFNDIIKFSELKDEYLSQPVRKYSSGMRSKLGFSIAIHINPDILIIDEALAVGDARFQEKCHDKIKQMQNDGMTILYVSHSSGSVAKICQRAVWLNEGEVVLVGECSTLNTLYSKFMLGELSIKQAKFIFEEVHKNV